VIGQPYDPGIGLWQSAGAHADGSLELTVRGAAFLGAVILGHGNVDRAVEAQQDR
jgi:hypothetical protein